ncbi:DNA polymerase III, clamp loader complex, gamma/delta/delta subunit [Mycena metata]|uniref:DNA polymerase III, clamp loader complex, gamma/delta/delta subunit n=1 Tax=Mycena metata TaxID=1033252 RepID=A0AAD7P0S3_9AGAR|nr:DNA polymerase III, clamp loader complex, gamma/delta/delta subunit [Mycena metata]
MNATAVLAEFDWSWFQLRSPICSQKVQSSKINSHIDAGCSESDSTPLNHPPSSSAASSSNSISPATQKPSKKSASQNSDRRANIAPIFNMQKPRAPDSPPPSVKRAADNVEDGFPRKRRKINLQEAAPLAEKLRPTTLSDVVGHESVVSLIASGSCGSLILWGPSGCGKTTLARLMATETDAVRWNNDVRAVVEAAKTTLALTGRKTILFLDEIHRFNKGQQDIFLPFLERGYIQLIGATTENPSFKLIGALLSRCRVFSLERLQDEDIRTILNKALNRLYPSPPTTETVPSSELSSSQADPESSLALEKPVRELTDKIITTIVSMSAGDARIAISLLELSVKAPPEYDEAKVLTLLRRSAVTSYDTAEDHYNMISALHKSVRGSQPSAALYWLARMLTGGEDPLYICRRMVVCASEDIGLADNQALPLAVATLQACQNIGMPECRVNLAHLVSYLSEAPKSTRAYEAYKRAEEAALADPSLPVPLEMRNAPTTLMKEVGYGKSYMYNPEFAHPVHNTYLPAQFRDATFLKVAGDTTGKAWDEEALVLWEKTENGGERWKGRDAVDQMGTKEDEYDMQLK